MSDQELIAQLVEALEWYRENARLCRLIHSGGDVGRHALAYDGGNRAQYAITAAKAAQSQHFSWQCKCGYYNHAGNVECRACSAPKAATSPGHTDLMVTPEQLDEWLKINPPPDEPAHSPREPSEAAIEAATDLFYGRIDIPQMLCAAYAVDSPAIAPAKVAEGWKQNPPPGIVLMAANDHLREQYGIAPLITDIEQIMERVDVILVESSEGEKG